MKNFLIILLATSASKVTTIVQYTLSATEAISVSEMTVGTKMEMVFDFQGLK